MKKKSFMRIDIKKKKKKKDRNEQQIQYILGFEIKSD